MSKRKKALNIEDVPSSQLLTEELKRENNKIERRVRLRNTIYLLLAVMAIIILVSTRWTPIFQIYGTSMVPTLNEGEVVIALKGSEFKGSEFKGQDIVGVYVGNQLLVKRIIAEAGQWVNIDNEGVVYINGEKLDEPYLQGKAYGNVDIKFPYKVPQGKIFVMGDHRSVSVDSRNKEVGCISKEQIVGRVVLRVWPINKISVIKR